MGTGISIYWHLPFLLVAISIVYSATRFEEWDEILLEAWRWGSRMCVFILIVAVVLVAVAYLR